MVTGRKLQIDKLSIWIENGKARFAGLSREEAGAKVRASVLIASEWLDAFETEQDAIRAEKLTPQEQESAKRLAKKKKLKLTEKSAEKIIRSLRGEDFSDL